MFQLWNGATGKPSSASLLGQCSYLRLESAQVAFSSEALKPDQSWFRQYRRVLRQSRRDPEMELVVVSFKTRAIRSFCVASCNVMASCLHAFMFLTSWQRNSYSIQASRHHTCMHAWRKGKGNNDRYVFLLLGNQKLFQKLSRRHRFIHQWPDCVYVSAQCQGG